MDTDRYRVKPGSHFRLADVDCTDTHGITKGEGREQTDALRVELENLQEMLWADHTKKVLVVLQAIDAGGKDGTVRSVFEGVNPQGVRVVSFKAPTQEELEHDYLWRVHKETPRSGEIAIFNRSHYEDVLVVRVHQLVPEARWRARYKQIEHFENMLVAEGTTVRKFLLHITKDEQRERQQERIDNPEKRWKFAKADLDERKHWDAYMDAFEETVQRTSTETAPWYVVPANRNWYRNLIVTTVLVDTLRSLDLRYPKAPDDIEGLVVE
jgi:PPK2 family polyphosphate:nucleotide phosphotransferase